MKKTLSNLTVSYGAKELSSVDLPGKGSHQHEIAVPKRCRHVFGSKIIGLEVVDFIFIGPKEQFTQRNVDVYYYNVRQGKKRPPEYRLYYPKKIDSYFSEFRKKDLCIFIKDINHDIRIVICSTQNNIADELKETFWRGDSYQLTLYDKPVSNALCQLLRLSPKFFLHNLRSYDYRFPENIGSKDKGWYSPNDNRYILSLFKKPNRVAGEPWAEKISFELARLLRISAAKIDFCEDLDEEYGSLSRSFIPRLSEQVWKKRAAFREFRKSDLILGNQIMHAHLGQPYSEAKHTRNNPLYHLRNIKAALNEQNLGSLWPQLLEYLYFDTFIGNLDRHHENWGIIQYTRMKGDVPDVVLAPTFDHGPSLDSGSSDEKKQSVLERDSMEAFYSRGKTVIHVEGGKRAYLPELVLECIKHDEINENGLTTGEQFADKLRELTASHFRSILSRIPDRIMSRIAKDFTVEYLSVSQKIILGLIDNEQ